MDQKLGWLASVRGVTVSKAMEAVGAATWEDSLPSAGAYEAGGVTVLGDSGWWAGNTG